MRIILGQNQPTVMDSWCAQQRLRVLRQNQTQSSFSFKYIVFYNSFAFVFILEFIKFCRIEEYNVLAHQEIRKRSKIKKSLLARSLFKKIRDVKTFFTSMLDRVTYLKNCKHATRVVAHYFNGTPKNQSIEMLISWICMRIVLQAYKLQHTD